MTDSPCLGHETLGNGPLHVIVLNDWISDTSSWDAARPYLDPQKLTWAFADLRGYGRSKSLTGDYNLQEAAADVLALADKLGWQKFAVVGHSMSSLIALHLGQQFPDRVERVAAITPPPPSGFGVDAATLGGMQAMARGNADEKTQSLGQFWGSRLNEGWVSFKARRWSETANSEASAQYTAVFATDGLPNPSTKINCPVLALTGEQDQEGLRRSAVADGLAPICPELTLIPFADCGHYPMQEAPPLFASVLEHFLAPE